MAKADMLLRLDGITGEAKEKDHPSEIEVLGWSWGIQGMTDVATNTASGKARFNALQIVKMVDASSPALMQYVNNNTSIPRGKLTVRKAGGEALEYLVIEMGQVRVTSVTLESEKSDVVERVKLSFVTVDVHYTPQQSSGAGSAKRTFHADAHSHT